MKNTYFIEKLEQCCAAKGMKRTTFCKDFGISEATVRTWIRQGNYPQADVLYRIAKYFGVPIEYFMDGSENPFTDREILLLVRMKSLSDEQINKLQLQLPEYNLKKTKLIW